MDMGEKCCSFIAQCKKNSRKRFFDAQLRHFESVSSLQGPSSPIFYSALTNWQPVHLLMNTTLHHDNQLAHQLSYMNVSVAAAAPYSQVAQTRWFRMILHRPLFCYNDSGALWLLSCPCDHSREHKMFTQ